MMTKKNAYIFGGIVALVFGTLWLLKGQNVLSVEHARFATQIFEVRSEQEGLIEQVCCEEGQKIERGEKLFLFNQAHEQEKLREWKQKEAALCVAKQESLERLKRATEKYLVAQGEKVAGLVTEEAIEVALKGIREERDEADRLDGEIEKVKGAQEQVRRESEQKTIRAGQKGTVVTVYKKERDAVLSGEKLCDFYVPEKFWVEAKIPEAYWKRVALGQRVEVILRAAPKEHWEGVVSWVSPVAHLTEEGIPIRVAVEKRDKTELLPNLKVDLKIHLDR